MLKQATKTLIYEDELRRDRQATIVLENHFKTHTIEPITSTHDQSQ